MLKAFYEKKKILLAIEGERRGFGVKRARMDEIPEHLPHLEPEDFEFLKQICPLLEIFHIETKKVIANFIINFNFFIKFSLEKSTCSTVLPTLKRIRDFLVEQHFPKTIAPIAEKIAKTLQERVGELCNNDLLRISMLLDPRYAYDTIFFSTGNWKIVEQLLIEFAKKSKN
jgi:hypothetical protein